MAREEQRAHPRHVKKLPVRIFRRGAKKRDESFSFSATVHTHDISVGGVFMQSTFFLPKGSAFEIEIDLPKVGVAHMAAEVVHVIDDTSSSKHEKPSGFASQFTKYYDDSEILLRAFLMRGDLSKFVKKVMRTRKKKRWDEDALVELIVRWKMQEEQE